MKKLLLFILLSGFIFTGYGQSRAKISNSLKNLSVKAEQGVYVDGSEVLQGVVIPTKAANLMEEEEIGETYYDKQSNRAMANKVYRYSDGTMAAVWTYGINATGFDDRGAGYNFYDGSEWGEWPTERVETVRCGWPSYAPMGENGEIVVSHNAVDALIINRRPEKGSGDWDETILQGPAGFEKVTWPRVISEGVDNNIVHALGLIREYPNAGEMTLAYYRSMNGGEEWETINYEIPGTGHDFYTDLGADSYTFAEPKNGVIAFFVANLWCDAFIMKSTDHGDTWEKTIVWEHPYPFYDDNTVFSDTLWAPDNSGHIALDNEGKAHVVFGLGFIYKDVVGTSYSYWPGLSDGIAYWNEDMPAFEYTDQHDALDPYEVLEEDVNLIGWSLDMDGNGSIDLLEDIIAYSSIGLCTMPNITIDDDNKIYVVWAATTEGYDNGLNNFKHIFNRTKHADPNVSWSGFNHITENLIHIFDECIYPQFAPLTDDNVYLMYNTDASPGNAVDGDHDYQQNKQMFVTLTKDEILGVGQSNDLKVESVSQNHPNPFSTTTVVQVDLDYAADLSLEVYNLVGQNVYSIPVKSVNAGTHHLTIDGSGLKPGVYIYSVFVNDNKVNRKMILE